MLKELMGPKFNGHIIEIDLSQWGYKNYIAESAYHFDKKKTKYALSIWITRSDIEDRMRLFSKKIDTQYISGTRDTIVENICRIVHQAATVTNDSGEKYFDKYVKRYEYELACFEKGNELFEQERLKKTDDNNK